MSMAVGVLDRLAALQASSSTASNWQCKHPAVAVAVAVAVPAAQRQLQAQLRQMSQEVAGTVQLTTHQRASAFVPGLRRRRAQGQLAGAVGIEGDAWLWADGGVAVFIIWLQHQWASIIGICKRVVALGTVVCLIQRGGNIG